MQWNCYISLPNTLLCPLFIYLEKVITYLPDSSVCGTVNAVFNIVILLRKTLPKIQYNPMNFAYCKQKWKHDVPAILSQISALSNILLVFYVFSHEAIIPSFSIYSTEKINENKHKHLLLNISNR